MRDIEKEFDEFKKDLLEVLKQISSNVPSEFFKKFDHERWIKGATLEYKEEQSWPKEGDKGFNLQTSMLEKQGFVISDNVTYIERFLYPLGFYKTREDAEIMRDWHLAQQLNWMPEKGEEFFESDVNIPSTEVEPYIIMNADFHQTIEKAKKHSKLMKQAAEIKLKYLKLKKGV